MPLRQASMFSLGSLPYKHNEESYFDDMTMDELRQKLEDVVQKNLILALENDVFERYLTRQDPQSLKNLAQILERAKHVQNIASQLAPMSSRMSLSASVLSLPGRDSPSAGSLHSESRCATPSLLTTKTLRGGLKITLTHRMEMAKKEVEEMRKRLVELEVTAAKKKANLRAKLEELELRVVEAYEVQYEFKYKVVEKGIDPITGKIPAETIVRFVENWLKTADTVIERLRLKSTTIKNQIKKAKQQLIQREELGETLHAVDFEQLKIQNIDYVRKIDEKNRYLLEMKRITGRYSLELTKHKQKLNDLLQMLASLKKEIVTRQQLIAKLQNTHTFIKADVEIAKEQLASLVSLMETYKVPDVLDFVKLYEEYQDLQQIYKGLCRRKNIHQIMSKSNKNQSVQLLSSGPIRRDSKNVSETLFSIKSHIF